ncbi:hypothetical protein SBA2_10111 [Acidobacteriia bacterium SbA2]|nr:hypothetical protein SBA2_10111 [Acidobacteriia bacterium SbA2]
MISSVPRQSFAYIDMFSAAALSEARKGRKKVAQGVSPGLGALTPPPAPLSRTSGRGGRG